MSVFRPLLGLLSPLLVLTALGCAPDVSDPHAGAGEPASGGGGAPPSSPMRALAITSDGALALIAGDTGALLATAPPESGEVRSIAFDSSVGLALAARFDDLDTGELAGLPLDGDPPAFGAPGIFAGIDGDLRILAAPGGVVTFALGFPSSEWSWSGATSSASASLPAPLSAWITEDSSPGSIRVDALTVVEVEGAPPSVARSVALASPEGIAAVSTTALTGPDGEAIGDARVARLVPVPTIGDALLVAAEDGVLVTRRVDDAVAGAPIVVPGGIAATRVEAIVALGGGQIVLAAITGPDRLVAIALSATGAPLAASALDLPGGFAVADRFFSSDLLALSDHRVLVATGASVLAVDVTAKGGTIALTIDPSFDGATLRGPLAPFP